jgi:AraC family transcriptional regulator, arabinose operon regulatory protein
MDYRVESVIALMRDDPHQVFTLSRMARSVNLSVSRLHHLFNADMSMSPARYLRIVRLQAAKDLLETTFLSVKEIVALVGGNDESHFLREFKKQYGVTPSAHRALIPSSSSQAAETQAPLHLTGHLANEQ